MADKNLKESDTSDDDDDDIIFVNVCPCCECSIKSDTVTILYRCGHVYCLECVLNRTRCTLGCKNYMGKSRKRRRIYFDFDCDDKPICSSCEISFEAETELWMQCCGSIICGDCYKKLDNPEMIDYDCHVCQTCPRPLFHFHRDLRKIDKANCYKIKSHFIGI